MAGRKKPLPDPAGEDCGVVLGWYAAPMSEPIDNSGAHRCSQGHPTRYAAFSGGREYQCTVCDETGFYPEGQGFVRANLLRTPEGQQQLRAGVADEIARRRSR